MQKSDLGKGDVIAVEATVVEVLSSGRILVKVAQGEAYIEPGEVYAVTKRAIAAGDRVAFKEGFDTCSGRVEAIIRGFAIVDPAVGPPRVAKIEELERLPRKTDAGA